MSLAVRAPAPGEGRVLTIDMGVALTVEVGAIPRHR